LTEIALDYAITINYRREASLMQSSSPLYTTVQDDVQKSHLYEIDQNQAFMRFCWQLEGTINGCKTG